MEIRFEERNVLITAMPPRSRLYSIPPMGLGTLWVESLTSYINRLAWNYRVSPQALTKQEIAPLLNNAKYVQSSAVGLHDYCSRKALIINGVGEAAFDWLNALEQLTMRVDLQNLTLRRWACGAPNAGFLRETPAWCPICYKEWREEGFPIYQPLIWMLQVIVICPKHKRPLDERCPYCGKVQYAILLKLQLGYCRQCGAWLGAPANAIISNELDENTFKWQEWLARVIGELHEADEHSGELSWARLQLGLVSCVEAIGSTRRLASLTNVNKKSILKWLHGKLILSIRSAFFICYVLDITPYQLMTSSATTVRDTIRAKNEYRTPPPGRSAIPPIDRERALKLIQTLLEQEVPVSVRHVARLLGVGITTLRRYFPHECDLIATKYRNYRTQQLKLRKTQQCDEVRQATFTLHTQGIFPSEKRVRAELSNRSGERSKEVRESFHAARREIGLEP